MAAKLREKAIPRASWHAVLRGDRLACFTGLRWSDVKGWAWANVIRKNTEAVNLKRRIRAYLQQVLNLADKFFRIEWLCNKIISANFESFHDNIFKAFCR